MSTTPNWRLPTDRETVKGRANGKLKSQLAQAKKPVNPITLKRFSWEEQDEPA